MRKSINKPITKRGLFSFAEVSKAPSTVLTLSAKLDKENALYVYYQKNMITIC